MEYHWFRDKVSQNSRSCQTGFNREDVEDIHFPIAPLAEQRQIVAKLEKLLGKVDASQQRLAKIPFLLKRFRQSVLAAACSGRLTADWRDGSGSNMGDWNETPLKQILAEPLANGRSVPTAKDEFPVLRLTCLKAGRIDLRERKVGAWTAEAARNFRVRRGDFYVSRGNGSLALVGRGGLLEDEPDAVAFPDTLIRVRVPPNVMVSGFLRLIWDAKPVRDQIESAAHTTAGIWKISQQDLEGFVLPLPPLAEQQEIVRRVEALFALADQIEARYTKANAYVEKLTQSILAKAFRGELVPQDPNDEPASILLERIKRLTPVEESSKRKTKRPALAKV
jgi:type I restriction enzyme S subunit